MRFKNLSTHKFKKISLQGGIFQFITLILDTVNLRETCATPNLGIKQTNLSLKSLCALVVLFVSLFNVQPLLAQYDQESTWKDVIETTELQLKYTADVSNYICGNKQYGAFYHVPNMEAGWRDFGTGQTLAFQGNATVLIAKMINPNDPNPALKSPVDFVLAWQGAKSDSKGALTGGDYYIWTPKPAEGYVALGNVVKFDNATKPSVDWVWCVRRDLTTPAKSGTITLQINKATCYSIAPTGVTENEGDMHLVSGSFLPHDGATAKNAIPVTMVRKNYTETTEPFFTPNMVKGNTTPYKKIACAYFPTVSMPESNIEDWKKKLRKSQLMQLVTYEAYELVDSKPNLTTNPVELEFSVTRGKESTVIETISHSFNATLEVGYQYGNELSMNKGNVSLSLSYGFGYEKSSQNTNSVSVTNSIKRTVAPKTTLGVFQKVRRYELWYKDDSGKPTLLNKWFMTYEEQTDLEKPKT
jgi:hypothetical protein